MGPSRNEGWVMPVHHPYYPSLPATYRDVRIQTVFFEAAPAGVARFLPEPLEPSPDGACVAMGIAVPFCTACGAFNEALLMLKARFRGTDGWYVPIIWHDGQALGDAYFSESSFREGYGRIVHDFLGDRQADARP